MLYHLLTPLEKYWGAFHVFTYISFRAAGAAVTALLVAFLVGPGIIKRLNVMRVQQIIREGTPDSHQDKKSVPTMGGLIILVAAIFPTLMWAKLTNHYVWIAIVVMAWMGAIGFLDDYLKLKQKREGKENVGLVERYKLVGQVSVGVLLGVLLWQFPVSTLPGASTTVPFIKYILIVPYFAWMYVPWVAFILTGASNMVNLADGLDGLAAGLTAIAAATLILFAYVMGRVDASVYLQLYYLRNAGELAIFCSAIFGAAVGFLWFNCYPAEVTMGDTGALGLGGALGAVGILLKSEFLLLIIGGVFVVETASVIIQRIVFKYRRKRYGLEFARANRVFLRAPIHHHFELKGWPEPQVVVRFWILGVLCAFLALSTIKLR